MPFGQILAVYDFVITDIDLAHYGLYGLANFLAVGLDAIISHNFTFILQMIQVIPVGDLLQAIRVLALEHHRIQDDAFKPANLGRLATALLGASELGILILFLIINFYAMLAEQRLTPSALDGIYHYVVANDTGEVLDHAVRKPAAIVVFGQLQKES